MKMKSVVPAKYYITFGGC